MKANKDCRRTVVKSSSRGRLYLDWEPMPRVPDEYLECVVYLYPSIPAAMAGEKMGGTGFVIRINHGEDDFYYVVTNRHVVVSGSTTVRFNSRAGTHDALEFDERNWFKSNDADLAVYLIPAPDPQHLSLRPILYEQLLTPSKVSTLDIGLGDDVFLWKVYQCGG